MTLFMLITVVSCNPNNLTAMFYVFNSVKINGGACEVDLDELQSKFQSNKRTTQNVTYTIEFTVILYNYMTCMYNTYS